MSTDLENGFKSLMYEPAIPYDDLRAHLCVSLPMSSYIIIYDSR